MTELLFHQFSNLPVELRLQIWNAACVFHRPKHYSLHYVDVEVSPESATLLVSHNPTSNSVAGLNKSSCLKDGGNWHAAVLPTQDVFCIKASNWDILHGNSEAWKVAIPTVSSAGPSNISINIALESDPYWNIDLPESYYDLMTEISPRGSLAWILYNTFIHSSAKPKIWITDRTVYWAQRRFFDPNHTENGFHDCDTEYVPAGLCSARRHCLGEESSELRRFQRKLDNIGEVCKKYHSNYTELVGDFDWEFREIFETTSELNLLAYRDTEVEFCDRTEHRGMYPRPTPTSNHDEDEEADTDSYMMF
ncbi:hypothetical protein FBEOM_4844 [Fusarium beomiforme]|uniref:2EXR domain-containing protein n=1 Tax=Fusarium beomiforme TaxID=44412 RepID=A0A9P5DZK4_9HYPO|nr:hypothetical protein FBEOM_4844 [Fusarium beomiforme]